jgi:hypothetical protein
MACYAKPVRHKGINTAGHTSALTLTQGKINPAAVQRRIHALTNQLLTTTTSKAGAGVNKRARIREATNSPTRAS